jgi:hypothetical protein
MDLIFAYSETPPASPASANSESVALKRKADLDINQLFGDVVEFDDTAADSEAEIICSSDDENTEEEKLKQKKTSLVSTKRRIQLSLVEKKNHVERYWCYYFQKMEKNQTEHEIDIDNDQLMVTFVKESNSLGIYSPINISCLSRWIRAHKRGEFDLMLVHKRGERSKRVADKRTIVQRIDYQLKKLQPNHAAFNRIDWSPSLPKEYGVVARKFTPSGTFLGFYKGAVLTGENRDNRNYAYTFAIGRNLFIDTSAFLSCFARYYNCATDHTDQNVSVELLPNWENPQKAICFIANRNIMEGEEFLVSYGPEYWANFAEYLPRKSQLLKVCAKLSNEAGYSLFTPRYSLEAPTLAANFLDDGLVAGQ